MNSPITTHVLNTATGLPASGIATTCYVQKNSQWQPVGNGITDNDGRIADLITNKTLEAGVYRLHFAVAEYFAANQQETFYPYADVVFQIKALDRHYHVPLLLSPYGYSTYRGS